MGKTSKQTKTLRSERLNCLCGDSALDCRLDVQARIMLKENMIYLMNLFPRKGVRQQVCSRKEACYEEVSSGVGAHQESSSAASSPVV
jgi:hypothetical protein